MKGGLGSSEIDMVFPPYLIQEGQRPLAVDKGFKVREAVFGPGEGALIDYHTPDGCPVTT